MKQYTAVVLLEPARISDEVLASRVILETVEANSPTEVVTTLTGSRTLGINRGGPRPDEWTFYASVRAVFEGKVQNLI